MKRVSSEECRLFLAAYYAQSNIDTDSDDWMLDRKYKNFHNQTCRDFTNKKIKIKAMVAVEDNNKLVVRENFSYKDYLIEMRSNPLFYFVPVISNAGLMFLFEKTMKFNATWKLDPDFHIQKPFLVNTLNQEFNESEYVLLDGFLAAIFPKVEMDILFKRLRLINIEYNSKIYDLINKEKFQEFRFDSDLLNYDFPEDVGLSTDKKIEILLSIFSKSNEKTKEDYARVKSILGKMKDVELKEVEMLVGNFCNEDQIIKKLLLDVKNRKESLKIWHKIRNNK